MVWLRKSFTSKGFEVEDKWSHICKLKKALYGMKKAPRTWYGRIESFLSIMGFTKSKADPNLYLKVVEDEPVILLLYVDELFLTGKEKQIMESKEKKTSRRIWDERPWVNALFPRSGSMAKFRRNLSQSGKYAVEILKIFDICWDVKPWPYPWIPTWSCWLLNH